MSKRKSEQQVRPRTDFILLRDGGFRRIELALHGLQPVGFRTDGFAVLRHDLVDALVGQLKTLEEFSFHVILPGYTF